MKLKDQLMSDVLKVPALVDASGEVAKFPSDTLVLTHRGKQLDPIMEELVRPGGYSLTYGGVVRLTRVDLLEIKQSFSYYYCEACTNTPTGITGWLNVSYVTELYMILVFTEVATKNVYRRHKINGVWADWKLVEGEVILWSGAASTVGTVLDLQHSIKRFGSFDIYIAAYCMHALVKRDVGDPFLMGDFIYLAPANTAHYIGTATLHCKTPTQMTLYSNALSLVHTIGQNHVKGTDYTITKILGRP